MIKRSYSIHDIIRFEIIYKSGLFRKLIDKTEIQFKNFESNTNDQLDFKVEIGPFVRQKQECFILDDRYFIGDNYFYCKDKRKYARWELEVSEVEGHTTVRIQTNLAGYYTVPLNVIEFFIHYMLLKKGKVLIHSSGVLNGNKCYLFPARGGGGKTTIALSLVDGGYCYLGDNFILVDKGKTRSFISPLNIFSYNRLGIVERNLNNRQRISMLLKQIIYKFTGGYVKIFEKINPSNIFSEQIVNESAISHIFILEPDSGVNGEVIVPEQIDFKTLIKKLRYNMELDLQLFTKYMISYGYINTNSVWANFWEIYEGVLRSNISHNIPAYAIRVPTRYNSDAISQLVKQLQNH